MSPPPQHQPKSDAGRNAALRTFLDLQSNPLGTQKGENFGVPSNYVIPPARIYVRNWSRTHQYKYVWIPVSFRRGAEDALREDKELAKIYNVDTIYNRIIRDGQDFTRYKNDLHPVALQFLVGGQKVIIPPAKDADSEPPKVEVPEGSWDLFLGNYDRMRAVDVHSGEPNRTVIMDEQSRLSFSWRNRHNPVMRYTDDGVETTIKNEFGFIEFIREPIRASAEVMDKDFLTAMELVEV